MTTLKQIAGGLLAALLLCGHAFAQGSVQQSGPAIPANPVVFIQNGIVTAAGPASGGGVGQGISELLMQSRGTGSPPYANSGSGPLGTNGCDYDAPITNSTGYHYLCWSANAFGGGILNYGAGGGATELPFQIIVNGVPWAPGGSVTAAFRLVTAASAVAVTTDGTIAFKSTIATFRTTTLYACDNSAKGFEVSISDDSAPGFQAGVYPIFVTPSGTDTITYTSVYPMGANADSRTFQCDGAHNWIIK